MLVPAEQHSFVAERAVGGGGASAAAAPASPRRSISNLFSPRSATPPSARDGGRAPPPRAPSRALREVELHKENEQVRPTLALSAPSLARRQHQQPQPSPSPEP